MRIKKPINTNGWTRVYRKEWQWFRDSKLNSQEAFFYLILRSLALWSKEKGLYHGTLDGDIKQLMEISGLSENSIYKRLKVLREEGYITESFDSRWLITNPDVFLPEKGGPAKVARQIVESATENLHRVPVRSVEKQNIVQEPQSDKKPPQDITDQPQKERKNTLDFGKIREQLTNKQKVIS